MEKENYKVYMHKNKTNGKVYIGITRLPVEKRWGRNGRNYKQQNFHYAIDKYGWDGFEHIILFENLTKEEAATKEIELISKYKSNNSKFGYNHSIGGEGTEHHVFTEEQKQKISESMKAYRQSLSEEQKEELNAKIKKNAQKSGKKMSEETKEKLRQYHLNKGLTDSGARKVIFRGKECTVKDVAKLLDKNEMTIYSWLRGRYVMPLSVYNDGLRYKDEPDRIYNTFDDAKTNGSARQVICDGKPYPSIKACADAYDIRETTMRRWLSGTNRMPAKFEELGLSLLNPTEEESEKFRLRKFAREQKEQIKEAKNKKKN